MMMRRLCVTLACALVPLAALSGCGGGHTHTGPTSGLSIKQVKHLNKVNAARALSECNQAANNSGIPPDQQALMQTECRYIKTDNIAGQKSIDRQLCYLQAAAKPEPLRSQLRAQCKTLTPTVPGATTTP
jgi:hypothetical protein